MNIRTIKKGFRRELKITVLLVRLEENGSISDWKKGENKFKLCERM